MLLEDSIERLLKEVKIKKLLSDNNLGPRIIRIFLM